MIFQITEDGENIGLIKDVECHGNTFSPSSYGEIIDKSIKLFKEIGEDEGWDKAIKAVKEELTRRYGVRVK